MDPAYSTAPEPSLAPSGTPPRAGDGGTGTAWPWLFSMLDVELAKGTCVVLEASWHINPVTTWKTHRDEKVIPSTSQLAMPSYHTASPCSPQGTA